MSLPERLKLPSLDILNDSYRAVQSKVFHIKTTQLLVGLPFAKWVIEMPQSLVPHSCQKLKDTFTDIRFSLSWILILKMI